MIVNTMSESTNATNTAASSLSDCKVPLPQITTRQPSSHCLYRANSQGSSVLILTVSFQCQGKRHMHQLVVSFQCRGENNASLLCTVPMPRGEPYQPFACGSNAEWSDILIFCIFPMPRGEPYLSCLYHSNAKDHN